MLSLQVWFVDFIFLLPKHYVMHPQWKVISLEQWWAKMIQPFPEKSVAKLI